MKEMKPVSSSATKDSKPKDSTKQRFKLSSWLGLSPEVQTPKLRSPGVRDLLFTALAAFLWWGFVHGRSLVIDTHCDKDETSCKVEQINPVDRLSVSLEIGDADGFSFSTQNISGAIAIGGTILTHTSLAMMQSPQFGLIIFAEDMIILAQTIFANGALTELSHLITHRPRPFVYKDPHGLGNDPAHYTSFYSGHTSFSGAAMMAFFLMLLRRRAPLGLLVGAAISAQTLMMLTGIFRVFAGRHFITDVVAGGITGALVAVVIAFRYRKTHSIPDSHPF